MTRTTVVLGVLVLAAGLAAAACSREMGLAEVKPAGGIMGGGETVTLLGSGFKSGQSVIVYFGSARAPHAFIEGSSKIVVTTPPSTESTLVDVRVISEDGKEVVLKKSFMYLKSGKWSPLDAWGAKKKGQ